MTRATCPYVGCRISDAASRAHRTAMRAASGSFRCRSPSASAAGMLWRRGRARGAGAPRVVVAVIPIYRALGLAPGALHAFRWQMVLARLATDLPLARLARLWLAARAVGMLVTSGTLGGEPV